MIELKYQLNLNFKECSLQQFAGTDFSNFFIWGDKKVTSLAVPTCIAPCSASDVVQGSTISCASVKVKQIVF